LEEYVLDSYALLAYFNSERSGSDVLKLFEAARDQTAALYLSQINLGEIFYVVLRHRGNEKAQDTLKVLRDLPIILCEASEARILAAAELKALYPISYADAFAAALAQELGASLVSGDPEFKSLEPDLLVKWI
jgi:predicted nucleic acid-binding protein